MPSVIDLQGFLVTIGGPYLLVIINKVGILQCSLSMIIFIDISKTYKQLIRDNQLEIVMVINKLSWQLMAILKIELHHRPASLLSTARLGVHDQPTVGSHDSISHLSGIMLAYTTYLG